MRINKTPKTNHVHKKNTILMFRQKSGIGGRILALFLLFFLSPAANVFYSMAVMCIYSSHCKRESLLATEGIELSLPGGLTTLRSDWYPFVMTFTADEGFHRFTGDSSLSLTILYNFPAFSLRKGCSRLYDTTSPYYNSFYGAYLIKDADGTPYGFTVLENGTLFPNATQTATVPKYDFFQLVLSEFGLTAQNAVFDWNITEISKPLTYAGKEGFYRIDATLTVNGASHHSTGFTPSYLQYGKPNYPVTEPLAPVSMYGRLYGTYLEEKELSLFFYIVAADKEVLSACDKDILSQSTLNYK